MAENGGWEASGTVWERNRAMMLGTLAAQELARAMAYGTLEVAKVQTETALGLARVMVETGSGLYAGALPFSPGDPGASPEADELPVEDYDALSVEEILEKLRELSAEETWKIRAYEKTHKNRAALVERFDRALV